MNIKKAKRLLSFLLALAILVCGLPFGAYATEASTENATYDYSTFVDAQKLAIEDYYSTLGMHDGVGLAVKDGSITVDSHWLYQINDVDKFVEAEEAYAIYFIENGTDFIANFSTTTKLDEMKFYVSGNGVDWDVAQVTKDYGNNVVSLIDQPDYISYVKISWPLYLYMNSGTRNPAYYQENALTAVTFTQGTHSSNYKRINYANETAVGGFQNQGLGIAGGTARPTWSDLDAAKAPNSYNGFVSYLVQPGTRFSLTVTNARGREAVGTELGYENPLDFTVEIYVSSDNVNFTKLENVYTNSARHPNYGGNDAIRSTDYSFIVPDDAVIVKCKFPMTQNLVSAGLCDVIGNDFMEINKVEYTELPEYDYTAIDSSIALTEETKDQFGVADATYYDRIQRRNGTIGYTWGGAYYNQIPQITYEVAPKTHFSVQFNKGSNLGTYVKNKDFVVKLQGWSPEQAAWVDAATLTLTEKDANVGKAMLLIPAEENLYTKVKVVWPFKVDNNVTGEDSLNIAAVSFTQLKNYDYTNTTTYGALTEENKASFGISSYSNLDKGEKIQYIDTKKVPGAYAIYNIMPGSAFAASFLVMGNMQHLIADMDFVMKLQGYNQETSAWEDADTLTIAKGTDYSTIKDKRYTLKIDANTHKYTKIKVQWPESYRQTWYANWYFGLESVSANVAAGVEYDYSTLAGVALNAANKSQFAISEMEGTLSFEDGSIDSTWGHLNGGGTASVAYDIEPNTYFRADFKVRDTSNFAAYTAVKDYVLKLQAYTEDNTWVDVKNITIPKGTTQADFAKGYFVELTKEENPYSVLRIQWPTKAANNNTGDNTLAIKAVTLTPTEGTVYDHDALGDFTAENKALFGMSSCDSGLAQTASGSGYVSPAYNRQGVYAQYDVLPNTPFVAKFVKLYNLGAYVLKNADFVMTLKGWNVKTQAWETVKTLTIPKGTDYNTLPEYFTMRISAEENDYTKIRVQWPNPVESSSAGKDVFGLKRVTFTKTTNYDYSTLAGVPLDAANKSQFGISEMQGTLAYEHGSINSTWGYLNGGGTPSVAYDIEPNTYFRADFKVVNPGNLATYTSVKDYVLKLQAYTEDNTWVDVKNITIPKGTTQADFAKGYSVELTKEENTYSVLRIQWPAGAANNNTGDDTLVLNELALTLTEGTVYDHDLLGDFTAENKALFGMSSCDSGLAQTSSGSGYVSPAYNRQGVYAQYNVVPNTPFVAKFVKLYNLGAYVLKNADFVMTLKGWNVETSAWETVKTLTIPKGTDSNSLPEYFTMRISAEENDYTKIRVQWPNPVESSSAGKDVFGLKRVTFTQSLNYDYSDFDGDGVCVTKPSADLQITSENVANYGATAVGGTLMVSTAGQLDPTGGELANSGHASTWISYTVAKNTPFYAAANVMYDGNLKNYLKIKDYVFTLQGKDSSGNYVDVKKITIPKDSAVTTNAKYGFKLTAKENIYTELRILWPARAQGTDVWTYNGDNALALTEVSYSTAAINSTPAINSVPKSNTLKPLVYEEIPVEEVVSTAVALRPQINMAYLGDEIDLSGLQVALTYATGETRVVDYGFTGDDLTVNSVGDNTVTVICRGAEVEVPVVGYCYMGDFNRDKEVDLKDLVRYKKYLVGVAENEGADITVNGDNSSAGVLVELRKYILGIEDCLDFTKQWRGHSNDTTDYTFKDTITLDVLNNYLGHAVNYSLGNVTDYYGGAFNVDAFNEGLGVALNVGAKYVQRSGGEWNMTGNFMSRWSDEIGERLAYAHSIDPEIIFEASIFESVSDAVSQIAVPAWVHEKFGVELAEGVEAVNYTRNDVKFADSVYKANSNLEDGDYQSTPDITKVSWQMLVYYRATQFIDLGYEAIHLGQTGLTGLNDTNNTAWAKVIGFIREYAAENARRGYVLINSHDDFNGFTYDGKQLCDFIMAPARPHAASTETETKLPSENVAQECIVESGHWGSPYGAGYTGVAPTGETYENYPYMVEFDNYGNSIPGGEENIGNPKSYVWGLDEYSWYCNQPDWYKVEFLEYLAGELATYNDNGFISMPLGRGNFYDMVNGVSRAHLTRSGAEEAFVKAYFE